MPEGLGCVEEPRADARGLVAKAVLPHSLGDECIVVWPDGAVVILDRVEAPVARRHRAHAPAAVHVFAQEFLHDTSGACLVDDSTPQQLAGVRRQRVDLALLAVQGERVMATALDPEVPIEAALQSRSVA